MSLIDIIKELEKTGHSVSYTHRKDGGYVITKLDGQSYKGKTGNAIARMITGATLSHARAVQLKRIRTPKGRFGNIKRPSIPEDLKKELQRVQRNWRKTHPDIEGTLSTRGLRYQIQKYGIEKARASLNKAWRYSEGYAYIDNVNFLIERIRMINAWMESPELDELIDYISDHSLDFKEDWIDPINQVLYDLQESVIPVKEAVRKIKLIMK